MNDLPQVYRKYELLFAPHLIPGLRDLRGEEWRKLIDYLSTLPDTHPDTLAFSLMMIELASCLTCEMDSYRAQRGCALCSRQAVLSFKGADKELIESYERSREELDQYPEIKEILLKKAA